MATSFAISIPQSVADGGFDPHGFRAYLGRAETLGFESAWTAEQVLGSTPLLGPIETMTYWRRWRSPVHRTPACRGFARWPRRAPS
jgi:hypothetical protein